MMAGRDRITELRIEGFRTLNRIRLRLAGLTVLIGENGSGKSTVIEACEILRRAANESFMNEFYGVHGGLFMTRRHGADLLRLGVTVEGDGPTLEYDFAIGGIPSDSFIAEEDFRFQGADVNPSRYLMQRGKGKSLIDNGKGMLTDARSSSSPHQLLLKAFGANPPNPAFTRMVNALRSIEVHIPFEASAYWVSKTTRCKTAMREPQPFEPPDRLMLLGTNLASVYQSLKNDYGDEHWRETMEYVRLGLGQDVVSINTKLIPATGAMSLAIEHKGLHSQIHASSLADGALAYLALVAIYRLGNQRSILAFDEPDLHLHPELLMRALDLFESLSKDHPVLITTHSDRLLDGLSDPVGSVALCATDQQLCTSILRPDKAEYEAFLKQYRGLGDIRAAGHERSVMNRKESNT